MSEEEKIAVSRIAEAFSLLQNWERAYILGWGDGVIAMSNMKREAAQTGE